MTKRSSIIFAMTWATLAMPNTALHAEDPFLLSRLDPRIDAARVHRDQIAFSERELAAHTPAPTASESVRLRELVEKMRPGSFAERSQVLEEFKRLLAVKKETGKQLLKKRVEADEAMRNYLQALGQAPAAFRDAADAIEERAKKERLPLYQDKQQKLADLVRELAANVEKQLAEAKDFSKQFAEAWDHVDGQVNYLESLEQVVAIMPNPRDAAISEKLRAEVDAFLRDADEVDKAFQNFTQTLLKKAVTDGPASYFHDIRIKKQIASSVAKEPKLVNQLPTLEFNQNFATIAAGQDHKITRGDSMTILRGGVPVATAVVKVVNADSCVICRTDGVYFVNGDQVRLPSRVAQGPSVARR